MDTDCAVLIVGGGPCGLMLANELGPRGIRAILVDEKPGTAFNPQANATQARTMEHYRRLGFADEIRALGLPPDYPTDIAYFTRFGTYELARFSLPSAREAKARVTSLSGSWSAAELPHRISQKFVETVLRRHAESHPSISIKYGWRLLGFVDRETHVEAQLEEVSSGERGAIRATYMVGADGARSLVRRQLGFQYMGEAGAVRDFFGGRMYALYVRAPEFYTRVPHAPAWMYVTFNRARRAFMAAVDGQSEFAFHTQLRAHEDESAISDTDAARMFHAAVGAPIEVEILSRRAWTAGYALVAEHLQAGRVFLGGDAAHLFTPAGGLGYNTAVEDAVNLGWKLAASLTGRGGQGLLASYEPERRPVAVRNTNFARAFAESLGSREAEPELEDDTPAGARARTRAGAWLNTHARAEFNIPGITFGARYDDSPIIVSDGTLPPPDAPDVYIPTACPAGRAPHVWLDDGRSLFDTFGKEWTLLRFRPDATPGDELQEAARRSRLELRVVDVLDAGVRELYAADLALIRPDQMVAWRGSGPQPRAQQVVAAISGHAPIGAANGLSVHGTVTREH
jgi:2-polyprenyl-6-methoxyphenol hydroxylase-like FAD-dependent oxidoreductase